MTGSYQYPGGRGSRNFERFINSILNEKYLNLIIFSHTSIVMFGKKKAVDIISADLEKVEDVSEWIEDFLRSLQDKQREIDDLLKPDLEAKPNQYESMLQRVEKARGNIGKLLSIFE